ncbi:hypothetical protein Ctob_004919 [Chrysochromulina tobinii]|uniref:SNF2 N-terminal domain-containing protein n=1 Tax=Chrysochromulina tobinii TaxID=1460289 RepID=A0A0M0JC14_9EUKA|nr:hypothetical protein Ctob_004919 [Chrysochromulina tobinii]|eukprot:KOO24114.1 hypothetical protein Ctob_004919 [Chrysochromulina sp. CCMP291]
MNALIRVGANTINAIMGAATPARHIVEDALRRSSGDVGTALNLLLDAQPEEVFSPPPPPPSFSPYAAPAADHAAATAGASGAHAANAIDLDDIDDSVPAVLELSAGRLPPGGLGIMDAFPLRIKIWLERAAFTDDLAAAASAGVDASETAAAATARRYALSRLVRQLRLPPEIAPATDPHAGLDCGTPFYIHVASGAASLTPPSDAGTPRGGILADEMGLGKTLQVIGTILADLEALEGAVANVEANGDGKASALQTADGKASALQTVDGAAAEEAADEAPTTADEAPTTADEAPTTADEAPTTADEAPTTAEVKQEAMASPPRPLPTCTAFDEGQAAQQQRSTQRWPPPQCAQAPKDASRRGGG